jgi:4-alpha-glucanotransferase
MDDPAAQAARFGIEPEYVDVYGQRQVVAPEAIERILRIMRTENGLAAPSPYPSVVVARHGHPARLDLAGLDPGTPVLCDIADAQGSVAHCDGPASDCRLPDTLPIGSYLVRAWFPGEAGIEERRIRLLVAPERTYQGDDPEARMWALAVQLYGVRSHRNWGHGDFTDLATLIDLAGDLGASGIGLNPLHALFDDRPENASPYAPNSRLFLNPLYIDVESIEEFPGLDAAGMQEVDALRNAERVDYSGVARAKLAGLRLAYARFRISASPERREDFHRFKDERGEALVRFASFEVLHRRFPRAWWTWPEPWHTPSDADLAALRDTDGEAVGFFEFVQWVADRQLAACRDKAKACGMPLGLYLDVAVGVDAAGADAWGSQHAILHGLSVGAPPDEFNLEGQNWGIATFHPSGLLAETFEPFRCTIAAAMRHAGAIRIDHVLGLNRLFLVPHGASSREGAYFRFPLEALLAVVAQESVQRRCIVIGEDLGTVPEDLRGKLAEWGLWSYRVMLFERYPGGLFIAPDLYPSMALATFTTHDLPTYAGWRSGHDFAVRQALSMPSSEAEADRRRSLEALRGALTHAGTGDAEDFASVARYLAATPSRLVVISIEDVLGVIDQPNLPGTVDEHPNWRQRLPLPLEEWAGHPGLRGLAHIFADAGRGFRQGPR